MRLTSAGVVNILANQGKTTLNLTDTTAGTGLTIGGDTNIYRSVANHLATDDLLDLSNVSTIASAATGVAIGDKISLYQTTTALAFGIGIQSSRTVLYVPSGGGVGIRASSTGTYRSGGTDAITLLATGVATFTGKVTAPSLQITTSPTSGYVLTSDATGNATWQAAPGGGSGITRSVTVTSGSYTAGSTASTDYIYLVAGAHNATLPTASGNSNRYTFKNNHSASVTVTRAGADTVEGATSISVSPGNSVDLISNGTSAWYVI